MSALLQLAYRAQKQLWKLLRPRTQGVKVMLFNDAGELLLIRNSYGRGDLFVLPGGGVRPFEAFDAAARREVREELGCTAEGLALISTHYSTAEGKRDIVQLFSAKAAGGLVADGREVAEARLFPLDALPASTSAATRRRVEELLGIRWIEQEW